MRLNSGRFRACYQKALMRSPALEGRLMLQFSIGPDGRVLTAQVSTKLKDQALASCFARAMYRITFAAVRRPAPRREVVKVSYPWLLLAN